MNSVIKTGHFIWFRSFLLIVILSGFHYSCSGQTRSKLHSTFGSIFFKETSSNTYSLRHAFSVNDTTREENPRVVAIILDITLGILGMHRLYLGTDLKVPIFYTLTLGGGTILWLVDLGLLIFSNDIKKFMNNPRLFMWTGENYNKIQAVDSN